MIERAYLPIAGRGGISPGRAGAVRAYLRQLEARAAKMKGDLPPKGNPIQRRVAEIELDMVRSRIRRLRRVLLCED